MFPSSQQLFDRAIISFHSSIKSMLLSMQPRSAKSSMTILGAPQDQSMRLNLDVLLNIAPYTLSVSDTGDVDRTDLCNLMLTCRSLYDFSAGLLLEGKVPLGTTLSKVDSFCDFILRDSSGARARSVRWLSVPRIQKPPQFDETGLWDSRIPTAKLVDVLRRLQSLEHLELHDTEVFLLLAGRSDVRNALTSLRNVNHLCMRRTRYEPTPLLEAYSTSLKTLSIHWVDEPEHDDADGLFYALAQHAQNVTRLALFNILCFDAYEKQNPNVEVLFVNEASLRVPETRIVSPFTNLQRLHVDMAPCDGMGQPLVRRETLLSLANDLQEIHSLRVFSFAITLFLSPHHQVEQDLSDFIAHLLSTVRSVELLARDAAGSDSHGKRRYRCHSR
ncbi:hypothetical protein EIP91_007209 [Steccherinum ochraceum]|uniref:F-box domain-containing protein n=1 Tax=Steccherinum ochraceum TaxID=92696 RepID=A0A4R0R4H7_9APHY|nr:hypothetical protein EIP91_007209 [Steccherinum ochraceum]